MAAIMTDDIYADMDASDLTYHGDITKEEAVRRLTNFNEEGGYLIRDSERQPGILVLSVFHEGKVQYYRIKTDASTEQLFLMCDTRKSNAGGKNVNLFKCMQDLVDFCIERGKTVGLVCNLSFACPPPPVYEQLPESPRLGDAPQPAQPGNKAGVQIDACLHLGVRNMFDTFRNNPVTQFKMTDLEPLLQEELKKLGITDNDLGDPKKVEMIYKNFRMRGIDVRKQIAPKIASDVEYPISLSEDSTDPSTIEPKPNASRTVKPLPAPPLPPTRGRSADTAKPVEKKPKNPPQLTIIPEDGVRRPPAPSVPPPPPPQTSPACMYDKSFRVQMNLEDPDNDDTSVAPPVPPFHSESDASVDDDGYLRPSKPETKIISSRPPPPSLPPPPPPGMPATKSDVTDDKNDDDDEDDGTGFLAALKHRGQHLRHVEVADDTPSKPAPPPPPPKPLKPAPRDKHDDSVGLGAKGHTLKQAEGADGFPGAPPPPPPVMPRKKPDDASDVHGGGFLAEMKAKAHKLKPKETADNVSKVSPPAPPPVKPEFSVPGYTSNDARGGLLAEITSKAGNLKPVDKGTKNVSRAAAARPVPTPRPKVVPDQKPGMATRQPKLPPKPNVLPTKPRHHLPPVKEGAPNIPPPPPPPPPPGQPLKLDDKPAGKPGFQAEIKLKGLNLRPVEREVRHSADPSSEVSSNDHFDHLRKKIQQRRPDFDDTRPLSGDTTQWDSEA